MSRQVHPPTPLGNLSFSVLSRRYDTPAEYYEDGGSLRYIPLLRTPSLFVVSRDDPFLGALPLAEVAANPNTFLAVTERGGHVAFLQV